MSEPRSGWARLAGFSLCLVEGETPPRLEGARDGVRRPSYIIEMRVSAGRRARRFEDDRCWHLASDSECPLFGRYRGQSGHGEFMSTRPSTTLADFEQRRIPKSVFL
jgi:hypothetical protein